MIAVRHLDQFVRALRELLRLPEGVVPTLDDEGGDAGAEEFPGAGPLGAARRVQGKLSARTAAAPSSVAVRQATRAPALRPPAITGSPDRATVGHRPRHPASSVFGAGATFFPATRQGCSTSATLTPWAGSSRASARRSLASMPPPAPWLTASTSRGASPGAR